MQHLESTDLRGKWITIVGRRGTGKSTLITNIINSGKIDFFMVIVDGLLPGFLKYYRSQGASDSTVAVVMDDSDKTIASLDQETISELSKIVKDCGMTFILSLQSPTPRWEMISQVSDIVFCDSTERAERIYQSLPINKEEISLSNFSDFIERNSEKYKFALVENNNSPITLLNEIKFCQTIQEKLFMFKFAPSQ